MECSQSRLTISSCLLSRLIVEHSTSFSCVCAMQVARRGYPASNGGWREFHCGDSTNGLTNEYPCVNTPNPYKRLDPEYVGDFNPQSEAYNDMSAECECLAHGISAARVPFSSACAPHGNPFSSARVAYSEKVVFSDPAHLFSCR